MSGKSVEVRLVGTGGCKASGTSMLKCTWLDTAAPTFPNSTSSSNDLVFPNLLPLGIRSGFLFALLASSEYRCFSFASFVFFKLNSRAVTGFRPRQEHAGSRPTQT